MMNEREQRLLTESGLSAALISAELERRCLGFAKINLTYESESTNRDAKEYYAEQGDSAVFIADGQTAGRGRRGRSFASPHGAGIYMSILIRPDGAIGDLTAVTTFTAVAVCRAIEKICGLSADVKWVNDIYFKGKKLGGILTEGALAEDMRSTKYVIVGIGLNVRRAQMPDELSDIVISLEEACGAVLDRNRLITEIIYEFLSGFSAFSSPEIREEYKRRSFLVGREVTVHRLDRSYSAKVLAIDDDMSLLLRLHDGSMEKLNTGEVSVK
jgi:BirA family biotin operon repressor/biotin-[acetyl-CoA-carboxylase] ligase